MPRAILASLALASLLLSGCSNDTCSQLSTAFQDLQADTQACPGIQPGGNFNNAACAQELNSCTSDDQSALDKAAQCAEKLPACVPGQETQFQDQVVLCVVGLASLSSACSNIAAPFIGGTTSS